MKSYESGLALNKKILRAVSGIYSTGSGDDGFLGEQEDPEYLTLTHVAHDLGEDVSLVSRKASVMVIGNVSAGKSTFVNWYTNEAVQRTGMAIETSGFTIVTSGRQLNELSGESTIQLYPQFKSIVETHGMIDYICTKTCPPARLTKDKTRTTDESEVEESSRARDLLLQLVDLIDTPGLSDGDVRYAFDVVAAVKDFAAYVDLILVFFEPVCQALGRTLIHLVAELYEMHPEKLMLCVTKMDDIRSEEERIKVLCQTTQSLTSKISSRHGFDLIPIYVPGAKDGSYLKRPPNAQDAGSKRPSDLVVYNSFEGPVNRIQDIVAETEKLIDRKVQHTLNSLNSDCARLSSKVQMLLDKDEGRRRQNKGIRNSLLLWRIWCLMGLTFLGFALTLHVLCAWPLPEPLIEKYFGVSSPRYLGFSTEWIGNVLGVTREAYLLVPYVFLLLYAAVGAFELRLFILQWNLREIQILTPAELSLLKGHLEFIMNAKTKWRKLYKSYIEYSSDVEKKSAGNPPVAAPS